MTSLHVSPQDAASELLRRRAARRSLIGFTRYTYPDYREAAHQCLIAEKLEAVERSEINRLIISIPPRHGKSELVSRRFPVWYLARNPSRSIITASYSTDLARTFGRDAREIARSREFRSLCGEGFGFDVSADTASKDEWMTTAGGMYVAAGVGRGITGRGAHLAVIDDPFKDRAEADSQLIRDNVWAWYTSTLYTRLEQPNAIVVCATRWHQDDLIGRLIEAMETDSGDKWEILSLPALKDGRALWPEKYDVEDLERIKAALSLTSVRDWQSLYQQQPAPDDGAFFRREHFSYYDEVPANVRVFGCSDHAVTPDGGDFTVHGVWALDSDDQLYLVDAWRRQSAMADWVDAMIGMIRMHSPLRWGVEKGPIWRTVSGYVLNEMRSSRSYCDVHEYSTTQDKATRAGSFQARMAVRKVRFRRGADYLDWLEPELLMFPAGKHDDGVDMCGIAGRIAAEIGSPSRRTGARSKRYVGPPPRRRVGKTWAN